MSQAGEDAGDRVGQSRGRYAHPLSGEVLAANADLDAAPQKINEGAYDAWLFKLKPSDPGELAGLLDAAAYEKVAEADKA